MTSERTHYDYIHDIQEAIRNIEEFIAGMDFERFRQDTRTAYAVVRALEIVGEAARAVPDAVRHQNPEIPWREMAGTRDKLIHQYFGVDLEVVWKTVTEDLPPLAAALARMEEGSSGA